jgi:hypothetical protein
MASTDMVVLVASGRTEGDAIQRDAVRATWAAGWSSVFFVVGEACPIPKRYTVKYDCELKPGKSVSVDHQSQWNTEVHEQDKALALEAQQHHDMVFVNMTEAYRHLPRKLKESYRWALQHSQARWIMKSDIDMYIRVGLSTQMFRDGTDGMGNVFDPNGMTVVAGGWKRGEHRPTTGKWAEFKYTGNILPPFPSGGAHVVSRAFAAWVVKNDHRLEEYQGEDTSLGIWLDEAPFKANLSKTTRFVTHTGGCMRDDKYVIGHGIDKDKLTRCYLKSKAATAPGCWRLPCSRSDIIS